MPFVSTTITADRAGPRAARRATEAVLTELRLNLGGDQAVTVILLVSELVTNAVLHGSPQSGGELQLTWSTLPGGVLRFAVTDQSSAPPVLRRACADDEHGRGLALVAEQATNFGWHPLPGGGKTVWYTLQLREQRSPVRPATAAAQPAAVLTGATLRAHGMVPGARPRPGAPGPIPVRRRHLALMPTHPAA
ncbi:ATP-binding protein [Kitasatospora sp. NPDC056327]|uniref:ATP-binding protein n=1 Tax=Kitasatospora sp. NPDC056327 TaxID=3345785 RepID=UPI0035DDADE2